MFKSKSLDGFPERAAKESGLDFTAGRSMSREIDDVLRSHFEQKQRVAVTMNYFAVACPFMPSFLLGALMLLGKLDNMNDNKIVKSHDFVREQTAQSQTLYMAAMREKMEAEKKKGGLECSRPIEGLPPIGKDKTTPTKKKQNEILQAGKSTERMGGPSLLAKAQTDLTRVVQKKNALESHLDELNKEQDFAGVCKVSSQIELLDKALKQLGC